MLPRTCRKLDISLHQSTDTRPPVTGTGQKESVQIPQLLHLAVSTRAEIWPTFQSVVSSTGWIY